MTETELEQLIQRVAELFSTRERTCDCGSCIKSRYPFLADAEREGLVTRTGVIFEYLPYKIAKRLKG